MLPQCDNGETSDHEHDAHDDDQVWVFLHERLDAAHSVTKMFFDAVGLGFANSLVYLFQHHAGGETTPSA